MRGIVKRQTGAPGEGILRDWVAIASRFDPRQNVHHEPNRP